MPACHHLTANNGFVQSSPSHHYAMQVDDLLAFSKEVRLQYPAGMPSFVGGQSMGALAALHAVLRDQAAWDGIVLGTATIDVEWNWLLRCVGRAPAASLLCWLH